MPPARRPHSSKVLPLLVLIVVLSFAAAIITYVAPQTIPAPEEFGAVADASGKTLIEIGNTWVSADVAITEAEREQGLSGRQALGVNEGMLFIHPSSGQFSYWMKDMLFPIDIIWINADRQIVGVTQNISPGSYPETFSPRVPILYALEVPAGFSNRNHIVPGVNIAF